jgi:predicted transcriptional regulator
MNDTDQAVDYIELAADIVSAYVSNNPVPPGELGQLTARIHAALVQIATGQSEAEAKAAAAPQQPAVPVKKSVTADHIVCLEDGRTFKSLKRHLRAKYDLSPEQYRAKWGLPPDYPMVAPNYAKARSDLAKAIGLGQTRSGNYDEAA